METYTDFEKFVNGLQWHKDFDAEREEHMEASTIIYGSVFSIRKNPDINLEEAYKNASLSSLIMMLLDDGLMIEEIATYCFIEPRMLELYFHDDNHLFYAIMANK